MEFQGVVEITCGVRDSIVSGISFHKIVFRHYLQQIK